MDANECTVANIENSIEIVWHKESFVDRKQKSGGQSAQRFERIRDEQLKQWCKEVADKVRVLSEERLIILAGPGHTKELVRHYLGNQECILQLIDVGYTNGQGIYEALQKSQETIKNVGYLENNKLVETFLYYLAKDSKMVEYGLLEDFSEAETILVHSSFKNPPKEAILINDDRIRGFNICVIRKFKKY